MCKYWSCFLSLTNSFPWDAKVILFFFVMYVYRDEHISVIYLECHSSKACVLRQSLSLALAQLARLASEPRGSACLPLCSPGLIGSCLVFYTGSGGVGIRRQLSRVSSLLPLQISGTELRSPGLCGKSFYLLSHLASPRDFYLVKWKDEKTNPRAFRKILYKPKTGVTVNPQ